MLTIVMLVGRIGAAEEKTVLATHEVGTPDRELTVLFLFWAISLTRVVIGVVRHETFGAEGTLALLAVLVVPWLTRDALTRPTPNRAGEMATLTLS